MKAQHAQCDKCVLNQGKHVPGYGAQNPDVIFVDGVPGNEEAYQGRPFSGQSGTVLKKTLEHFGISFEKQYCTYVCSCVPTKDMYKVDKKGKSTLQLKGSEMQHCRFRLMEEIKALKPKLVVVMGNTAVQGLFGVKTGIMSLRGGTVFMEDFNCDTLYTISPSAVLKSPKFFTDFTTDIGKVSEIIGVETKPSVVLETKYKAMTDLQVVLNGLDFLCKQPVIACDIETTGFDFMNDRILCTGFCWEAGKAAVLSGEIMRNSLVQYKLKKLFEGPSKFIWHNGKFDIKFYMSQLGLNMHIDEDIMLKHYCIDERKGTHSLGIVAPVYLGVSNWKKMVRDAAAEDEELDFSKIPAEILYEYNAKDCDYTFRLNSVLEDLLVKDGNASKTYRYLLIPGSRILGEMELYGIMVDLDYQAELQKKYEEDLDILYNQMEAIAAENGWNPFEYQDTVGAAKAPEFFNLRSPKQLAYVLFDLLKLPLYKGERTTEADAVTNWRYKVLGCPKEDAYEKAGRTKEEYREAHEEWLAASPTHRFVDALATYRKKDKLYGTYIVPAKEHLKQDGRVHATFLLHGTETGRLASRKPNLQNIPRGPEIKNLYMASPGYTFIQCDYSQAELRVLAVLSGDPFLRNTYLNGGDLHDDVARELFGEGFSKEQRVRAKAVNFGLAYGRTEYTIAEEYDIPVSEARDTIRLWFEKIPVAGAYIRERRKDPKRMGRTIETVFGRKRRFSFITNENLWNLENEAINHPVSSTAADCTLRSLIEMTPLVKRYGAHPVNEVHDSIVIECPNENLYPVAKIMKEVMESIPTRELNTDVPFVVDLEIGAKYGSLDKAALDQDCDAKGKKLINLKATYGEGRVYFEQAPHILTPPKVEPRRIS